MTDNEKAVYESAIALLTIEYGSCLLRPAVRENVEGRTEETRMN
jgi:hypothetical protein